MGFSFRKSKSKKKQSAKAAVEKEKAEASGSFRKKKQVENKQAASSARKVKVPQARGPVHVSSREFSSPLLTIEESNSDDSEQPETPASVLESLKVLQPKVLGTHETHQTDESLEVVVGAPGTDRTAETASLNVTKEEIEVDNLHEESADVTHEEVRKILFNDREDEEKEQNDNAKETHVAPRAVTPDEQPFDAKADYEVDEMVDLEKTLPSDFGRQNRADMHETNVTRKLLDAFNCSEDTTTDRTTERRGMFNCMVSDMFYDNLCGAYVNGEKRPYYNEQFTLKFLQEMTKFGVALLNHQPPEETDSFEVEDWTGRSVRMFIRPGNCTGEKLVQPSLEWSTLGGGWSRTGTPEVVTTNIDLLAIHSILDSTTIEDDRDDDAISDICFFSITTQTGNVHVFEAPSYEERDRIVNGLKNVIARLAYHLVAGDVEVSSELYSEDFGEKSGELPSLRTPTHAMNDISHSFLD